MKTARQFVKELVQNNDALFKASRMQVRAYFESEPSKEALVDHFVGRMANERMNMVEISKKIAELPRDTSVKELQMLCKQALDEANHFRMVKEVVEHLTGEEVDLVPAIDSWETRLGTKGASLIAKFNCQEDPIAMALYQMIAEGRSEVVWDEMAETIEDEFISTRYAKIARDEGSHCKIGQWKLAQLLDTAEKQAHAENVALEMRKELYRISCINAKPVAEARRLVEEAYNYTYTP